MSGSLCSESVMKVSESTDVSNGSEERFGFTRKSPLLRFEYGSWNLAIEEYGKTGGAKFYYRANDEGAKVDAIAKTGKVGQPVIVKATLSKGEIALIEGVINSKEFFSTEKSLKGEAKFSHGPKYSLQICLDDKCHKVLSGYPPLIPKHLAGDFEKFKAVWNLLWSFVTRPEFDKPHVRL